MSKSECNILEKMNKIDFILFRKIVINNVLATDMKEHFSLIHNFEIKTKDLQITQNKFS